MVAILEAGRFYSVPTASGDMFFFQVLRVISTHQRTPWCLRKRERRQPCMLLIQEHTSHGDIDDAIVVFAHGFSQRRPYDSIGSAAIWLRQLCVYDCGASEISGCLALTNERAARPVMDMYDAKFPVLALGQELLHSGYTATKAPVGDHVRDGHVSFRTTKIMSRRFYMQCVLRLPQLFARNLDSLPTEAPQSYYRLLLRGHLPLKNLSDKQYKCI